MFRYLICYLGSLKAKQLISFQFSWRPFWIWPPGGVSPHFWEGYPRSFFRVFVSDMKSTFKPLSPYNGHGFTRIFLYYLVYVQLQDSKLFYYIYNLLHWLCNQMLIKHIYTNLSQTCILWYSIEVWYMLWYCV